MGVAWNVVEAQWERQWKALVEFKAEPSGHCNVPAQSILRTVVWVVG